MHEKSSIHVRVAPGETRGAPPRTTCVPKKCINWGDGRNRPPTQPTPVRRRRLTRTPADKTADSRRLGPIDPGTAVSAEGLKDRLRLFYSGQ
jgi:hypothetical protein